MAVDTGGAARLRGRACPGDGVIGDGETAEVPYRGPDRRLRVREKDPWGFVWAAAVLATPVLVTSVRPATDVEVVASTAALTLALVAGLLACVSRRAVGDQRLVLIGAGLLTLACGPVFAAGFLPEHLPGLTAVPMAVLAGVPAVVLLALAPFGPAIDLAAGVRRRLFVALAVTVGALGLFALPDAEALVQPLAAGPLRWLSTTGFVVVAAFALVLAVVYLVRGHREHSDLLQAMALVPLACAVAAGVAAGQPSGAGVIAWSTLSTGLAGALSATLRRLLRAHREERRRVLAALSRAERLEHSRDESELSRERLHELRSGLLVLEGAVMTVVDDHYDRALVDAVSAEFARLRALLGDRPGGGPTASTFLLGDALGPVVTCAQASGLDVHANVADGLAVEGDGHVAAQVVHGLLVNAGRHAPGSPVQIDCAREGQEVVVRVADRGPGLAQHLDAESVFRRGVGTPDHGGEGLGLSIAADLMASQRGEIRLLERADGLTFELRLPAPLPLAS